MRLFQNTNKRSKRKPLRILFPTNKNRDKVQDTVVTAAATDDFDDALAEDKNEDKDQDTVVTAADLDDFDDALADDSDWSLSATDSDDADKEEFQPKDHDLEPEDRDSNQMYDKNAQRIEHLKDIFNQLNFRTHLQCAVGGSKTEAGINTLYGRLAKFTLWCLHTINNGVNVDIDVESVKLVLVQVCTTHFGVLSEYCSSELELICNFKASTIMNHIMDLVYSMQWFVLYRVELDSKYRLMQSSLLGFTTIATSLKRHFARRSKHESCSKSLGDAIISKKMPPGGLSDLQNALRGQSHMIKLLSETVHASKSQYQCFMGLMYATMYSFSAQGRIEGFEDISFDQYRDLKFRGHATTDKFKTRLSFGLQAVTASPESIELLHLYVTKVRPQVSSNILKSNDNKLFLDFYGTHIKFLIVIVFHNVYHTYIRPTRKKLPRW